MLVTSMTNEELEAAVYKDFLEMTPRVRVAFDRFTSNARLCSKKHAFIHSLTEKHTIRTRAKNTWTILLQHCGYKKNGDLICNCLVYTTLNRDKGTDYIFIIGPLTCFVVEIFTAHFLERYQERYLEPNHIDLRGTIPALYFLTSSSKRGQPIYIQKKNATKEDQEMCNYLQTEQGLACIKVEGKILTYITFINQDGLSRYKQSIYEEREVIDSFRAVFRENNSFDPLTWRALRNKLIRNKERSLMLMKRYCARLKRWGMDEYYEVTKDLIQYFEDNWDNLVKMAAREEAKYKRMKNEQIRKKLKFHLPPLPMSFTKDPNIPSEDPS